jgi:hypothetical protein
MAPPTDTSNRSQAIAVVSAPAAEPLRPAADIWSTGLYEALRDRAAEEHPGNFEDAFRAFCRYARIYTDMPRFRTWRTDFRRHDEAVTLHVLSRLDVNDFFRRHRPNDDGDDYPPPLATELDSASVRELADA